VVVSDNEVDEEVSGRLGEALVGDEQIWDMLRGAAGGARCSPFERAVLFAILEQALSDLTSTHRRHRRHFLSAKAWFEADYESSLFPDVKTFEGICGVLGLNPAVWRPAILALAPRRRRRKTMSHNEHAWHRGTRRAKGTPPPRADKKGEAA
jgi:hypothetical protein